MYLLIHFSLRLDHLANNLPDDKYVYTSGASERVDLLKQKGVYPYEYMDSFEKFEKTELPDKEKNYIVH